VDRAFDRIYKRHVGDVYRYALVLLGNAADAEDVTQTAFLNVFRAFQRGERPEKAQNWLITITHNLCRQRFRNAARRPQETELDEALVEEPVEPDEGPNPAELRRALSSLAFNQRSALVMREIEGRSYADIASILGVSVSAVETLLFRARRALREQLEATLTCREAELALSKRRDGRLPRDERGPLRAHLRECKECASLERRLRGQQAALKSLAAVPIPSSLASFFGGGGAALGGGAGLAFAAKAASVVVAGIVAAGAGYESVRFFTGAAKRPAAPARSTPVRGHPAPAGEAHFAGPAVPDGHAARQRQAPAAPVHRQGGGAGSGNVASRPAETHVSAPAVQSGAAVPAAPPAPAPPRVQAPTVPDVPSAPALPVPQVPTVPAAPDLPPAPALPTVTIDPPAVAPPTLPAAPSAPIPLGPTG
jgi:RNA polymerase sigma factor (sigma-70 family)